MTGNPARINGLAITPEARMNPSKPGAHRSSVSESKVRRLRAHKVPSIADPGGNFRAGVFSKHPPFIPRRDFTSVDVPGFHLRGGQVHRVCGQILLRVAILRLGR